MSTEHDPMSLLHAADEPAPDPWRSLALHARRLADLADRLADMAASDRIARDSNGDDEPALLMLDARELALRSLIARCKTQAYADTRAEGWSVQHIAAELGVSYQAVNKALRR